MPVTGREAVTAALRLTGRVNPYGTADENSDSLYFGVAPSYLTILVSEIAAAEGSGPAMQNVSDLETALCISDDSALRVLPLGLAMYFSVIDRDDDMYNHFSQLYYGSLLPSIKAPEQKITDYYGVLKDPGLMRG